MQMPACLHGGSQVALWSKMKGTATPRGVSACAEQTSASSAPQVKTRDNLRKAAVEPAKPPILSRAKTERVELEDTGAQSTAAADESPPLGFPPENDYMCRFNILLLHVECLLLRTIMFKLYAQSDRFRFKHAASFVVITI